MNAGEADPEGPATRAVVTALVARVAAASEEFAAMLIPAGAVDALCAVCVRHSEGGEAFDASRSVSAAAETMRELAKSTALRPGLRTALDVRALVETARYVPRRVGTSAGAAAGEAGDDDDARMQSREEARKFALTTMRALADPDKNDDAADFRARLRAGDGGNRDGLSALASCLEAPDAEVAIGLKEHAARCVADLAFDEGSHRDEILGSHRDEILGSGPRCPSLGETLRSIVASRSTPSLKLKAAAACAMWRATAPSRGGSSGRLFTAEEAVATSGRIGSLVHAKGVLEGLVRLLRKPTKDETKPPPTAGLTAAAEEATRRAAELAEFERLEREAASSAAGDGADGEAKPEVGPDADEPTAEDKDEDNEDKDDEDEDEDEDDKDGGGGGDGEPPDDGEKKTAKKKAAKKKKGGKRGKKGKKKGPTPGLLDGYVAAVSLIRRMCVDDVATIRRLHTLGAHLHLAKLRGHEDVRVRAGADATLRAMGGEPLAAAEMRAAEGAPAWHGRLNLPGVALGDLEMPASARQKLDALLPGARLD